MFFGIVNLRSIMALPSPGDIFLFKLETKTIEMKVIMMIPIQSINIPRKNRITIMTKKVPHFPSPIPKMKSLTTLPPPDPMNILEKQAAPTRIIITIDVVLAVLITAALRPLKENFP